MTRHAAWVLLLCAACAAAPQAQPPAAQARLAEVQARAMARMHAGDAEGAARGFDQALRIAASLEDVDAIAVNALNLAAAYQRLGRDAEARSVLAIVVDDDRRPFSESRRLQAELRRALVELALGQPAAAEAMATRADRRCGGSCEYAATLLNVHAEAALARGDAPRAATQAQAALEQARGRGERAEAANGLRTLGRAQLARGDALAARAALEQALELDRALAEPRKIFADLDELSRAAGRAGDSDAARDYGERARAVLTGLGRP
jgi:tetratricopeptide (TPR) repeat protein